MPDSPPTPDPQGSRERLPGDLRRPGEPDRRRTGDDRRSSPRRHPDAPLELPLSPRPLVLVPMDASLDTVELTPDMTATVGRRETCTIYLLAGEVSRDHAELFHRDGRWFVLDHGSRSGTRIEGQSVAPGVPTSLADGEQISFGPCSFAIRLDGGAAPVIELEDVLEPEQLTTIDRIGRGTDQIERFAAIMRSLADAPGRTELYERTAAIAVETTGFGRGAIVTPAGSGARRLVARVERSVHGGVTAASIDETATDRPYSRRLVDAALGGETAAVQSTRQTTHLQTVTDLQIHAAIGVPIRVGDQVRACLYLDSRAGEPAAPSRAVAVAGLLASACGLVLGNLARAELEVRQRTLQVQLEAAKVAQQGLLPDPTGHEGPVRWAMRMEPGLVVAGDLFDVIRIDDDRTAVLIGDVAGHGVGPGFRMAMSQSVLRTELQRTGDVRGAVERVHSLARRSFPTGHFLTLWAGVIDRSGPVTYVNAGHGHVRLRRPDGSLVDPGLVNNPPVGIDTGEPFAAGTLDLDPGDQLLLWSDGVVEQTAPGGLRFGDLGLATAAAAADGPVDPESLVRGLFGALDAFRSGTARTDDTTIAVITRG